MICTKQYFIVEAWADLREPAILLDKVNDLTVNCKSYDSTDEGIT